MVSMSVLYPGVRREGPNTGKEVVQDEMEGWSII
jgi:hypothetical protein